MYKHADFAPGLPSKTDKGNPGRLPIDTILTLVRQRHNADMDFALNKGYTWGKRRGLSDEQIINNFMTPDGLVGKYRRGGKFNYPEIWNKYYGKRAENYKDTMTRLYGDQDAVKRELARRGFIK